MQEGELVLSAYFYCFTMEELFPHFGRCTSREKKQSAIQLPVSIVTVLEDVIKLTTTEDFLPSRGRIGSPHHHERFEDPHPGMWSKAKIESSPLEKET